MRSPLAKVLLVFVALQVLAVDLAICMTPPAPIAATSFTESKFSPLMLMIASRIEAESEEEPIRAKCEGIPALDFSLQAECLSSLNSSVSYCDRVLTTYLQPTPVLLRSLLI